MTVVTSPIERKKNVLAENNFLSDINASKTDADKDRNEINSYTSNWGFSSSEIDNLSKDSKSKIHNFIDKKISQANQENNDLNLNIDNTRKDSVLSEPILLPFSKSSALSDKSFEESASSSSELLHIADKASTYASIVTNIMAAFSQLLKIPDGLKTKISKAVDILTNLSFAIYGADGLRIGIEKKNPYQALGFALEGINVWLGDTKLKYLIRGAGTGTDQIWVATDQKLKEQHGIEEGRFKTWFDGLVKVPQICGKMIKEIITNPIETVFTMKPKGHNALISSIGDIASTLGFAVTGKESMFGPLRDIAGAMFDWELLLSSKPLQKVSGILFVLESAFDFIARFMPSDNLRLFMNHLSIGSGRAALTCYKNSDPNAKKNKTNSLSAYSLVA